MTALLLTKGERKALIGRAHSLAPVVLIGAAGLTSPVMQEIDRALASHELIKVRLADSDRSKREHAAETICDDLSCAAVRIIGKVLVLFRPLPDDA